MAFNPRYTITQSILQNLAKIENVKETFEKDRISPTLMASLRSSAKISSIHYSTKIEGNRLTHKQVVETIFKRKTIEHRERDSSEVKAYYNAMNYMEKCLKQNILFSEKFISKLHDLVEGRACSYREGQNAIYDNSSKNMVYMPPEAKDVPALMKELVDWINVCDQIPHVIIASLAHYQFVTIHPYYDGNGRTARLITSFLMRKYGYGLGEIYSLEEYYANDLAGYYKALATHEHHNYYEGREHADLTGWVDYFVSGVAKVFEKIQLKTERSVVVSPSSMLRKLNVIQRKILELFVEFEEINSSQIAEYLGMSRQSGRLLANRWISEGFMEKANPSKKARRYRLAAPYEELLK
jgi:Fic family protein